MDLPPDPDPAGQDDDNEGSPSRGFPTGKSAGWPADNELYAAEIKSRQGKI